MKPIVICGSGSSNMKLILELMKSEQLKATDKAIKDMERIVKE